MKLNGKAVAEWQINCSTIQHNIMQYYTKGYCIKIQSNMTVSATFIYSYKPNSVYSRVNIFYSVNSPV